MPVDFHIPKFREFARNRLTKCGNSKLRAFLFCYFAKFPCKSGVIREFRQRRVRSRLRPPPPSPRFPIEPETMARNPAVPRGMGKPSWSGDRYMGACRGRIAESLCRRFPGQLAIGKMRRGIPVLSTRMVGSARGLVSSQGSDKLTPGRE